MYCLKTISHHLKTIAPMNIFVAAYFRKLFQTFHQHKRWNLELCWKDFVCDNQTLFTIITRRNSADFSLIMNWNRRRRHCRFQIRLVLYQQQVLVSNRCRCPTGSMLRGGHQGAPLWTLYSGGEGTRALQQQQRGELLSVCVSWRSIQRSLRSGSHSHARTHARTNF